MAANDSDSSDYDTEDYTTTDTLLGYASKDATDDHISQLGGRPSWLDPESPPSGAFAKCRVCHGYMNLLLQLHGDLPKRFPTHERRLYIFLCRRKACRRQDGSVRALRGIKWSDEKAPVVTLKTSIQQQVTQRNLGNELFGSAKSPLSASTNPFSAGTAGSSRSNPFSTSQAASQVSVATSEKSTKNLPQSFADALQLNKEPSKSDQVAVESEPWPAETSVPPSYPTYFLDADYEALDDEGQSAPAYVQPQAMEVDEGSSTSAAGKEDADMFESTIDKTFQRFADRLAQNPLQVLRYEFGGSPLLYSKTDAPGKLLAQHSHSNSKVATSPGMPRCTNCGASRVFEMQLTPHAIVELEAEEEGIDGMEWGTIIFGTCRNDCVPKMKDGANVGYLEEWVGVQWEENRR